MPFRIATPLVHDRSIALKHLQDQSVGQIANVVLTGTTDRTGNGGLLGAQSLTAQPVLSWLFDSGSGSNPCWLSSELQNPVAVTGPLTTMRQEIYNIAPVADDGTNAKGILQITDQLSGASVPTTWHEVSLWAYCSDASARTHSANFWSIGVFNTLVSSGFGWNVVKFPAPIPSSKHTIKYEFKTPSSWVVWVDGKIQTLTQVVANSLASVGDGKQMHNVGNVLENASGSWARNASHAFGGTIGEIDSYLESGSGVHVTTNSYTNPPAIVNKASTALRINAYLYNAVDVLWSDGGFEFFCPNRFTTYNIGAQHLRYGANTDVGSGTVNAPARVYV